VASREWRRRAAAPWRWVFAFYALALTIGTHWPELRMAAVGRPAPDKLLHMLAFGGLAFLFLQARWLRTGWLAGLAVLAWTALDEVTQALPGVRRTISMQDMVAGQLGVVVVVTWWWALLPLGGRANRNRLRWQRFLIEDLFRRPTSWVAVGAAGVAGVLAAAGLLWLGIATFGDRVLRDPPSAYLCVAFLGAVAAAHVTLAGLLRRAAAAQAPDMPCPACGASCTALAFAADGEGTCPACGEVSHRGMWREPMELPFRAVLRGALPATAATIAILAVGVLTFFLLVFLAHRGGVGAALAAFWRDLDSDLQLGIDLAAIGVSLAVGVRLYRMRQAVFYDRQHLHCRACAHDLTGAPIETGCGRCPECGLPFARYADTPVDG
jgi:VanZ family protein/ribosomal protein L37AE/L43A